MSTDQGLWSAVLGQIQSRLRKQQFDTWFRHVSPVSLSDATVELQVPNNFSRDWLSTHYKDIIMDSMAAVTGHRPEVLFVLPDSVACDVAVAEVVESTPAHAAPPAQPSPDDDIEIRLNNLYTFENFVVGPCNNLAHAAALGVAESPGYAYNPLFLHGSVGLGKTHLIQAIAHALLRKSPQPRLLYMSCENFMNQFIRAVQKGDLERFRYRYRHVDALLIDDIQFLAKGECTQQEFFYTFNTIYNAHKQIVITSDSPPKEIPRIEERLISRFKWGMVAKIDVPGFETRVAIVRKKAQLRHCVLPDDVAVYIAENIDTNIREIEGAIIRMLAVASLSGHPIDLAIARRALAESIERERKAISIEDIQNAIISHFHVKLSDLQSKKRSKSVALPRHICMYLARQLTSYSLEEIGGYFGGRDHSTVLHACERIEQRAKADPQQAATVQRLMEELRAR
jgi:chromosomal replication initiator protein